MTLFRMQERDLDLFLLEEFHCNVEFVRWFAGQLDLEGYVLEDAEHSVSAKSGAKWGETDVLAYFSNESETIAVLIEDKIAASFTDRQASRYHERASDLVSEGKAHRYLTVLVAPDAYLAGVEDDGWQKSLSMEAIRDWFLRQKTPHASWREAAMTACLARLERTARTTNEDVLRFSNEFASFLQTQPGSFRHSPTHDRWGLIVSPLKKQKYVYLVWKFAKNRVDLTFSGPHVGKAQHVAVPRGVIAHFSDGKLKSDIFAIEVPPVDISASLESEADVLAAVMAALYELNALIPVILAREV